MPKSNAARRLSLLLAPFLLLLAVAFVAAACGGDGEKGAETPGAAETATAAESPAAGGPATFDVSQGDNFFDTDQFTASAGQEVTFNITNGGQATHNMHIAVDGQFAETICKTGGEEPCSDPEALLPGSTATLEWTAPDEPGSVKFRCDFHPTEMTGTIAVE